MIGYHWSPLDRRNSIKKHGLLVPSRHPVLVAPVVCSDGHRNPHISLGRTPWSAWELSGGFLERTRRAGAPMEWDLWEVDLSRKPGRALPYWSNGHELQVRRDIGRSRIALVAHRLVGAMA